jgi:hypothetical protein
MLLLSPFITHLHRADVAAGLNSDMDNTEPAVRQPNGDLLIPARTAETLKQMLQDLRNDLTRLEGRTIAKPGNMETRDETAHRQDAVDKLSASIGVVPPTVVARHMPDTPYMADTSDLLERLQALSSLLFDAPRR